MLFADGQMFAKVILARFGFGFRRLYPVLCDKDSCVNLLFHHFAKLLLLHHRITPNFTTAAFIHSI